MAHKPVGNNVSIACTPVNNRSGAIKHQSDSLRVVAIGTFAHVAIGTFPTATRADYMITPDNPCLLYTSPSPRDRTRSRMPSSA